MLGTELGRQVTQAGRQTRPGGHRSPPQDPPRGKTSSRLSGTASVDAGTELNRTARTSQLCASDFPDPGKAGLGQASDPVGDTQYSVM